MAYTVQPNRILPLHNMNNDAKTPHAAIQSITMGVRVGSQKYAIGYIQKFSFDMKRDAKAIWQIEPYLDVLGMGETGMGVGSSFSGVEFNEETKYYPGEAIEVIPGKMSPLTLKLSRYSLYTGNLLSAMMRATGAGVYDSTPAIPNMAETSSAADAAIKYVNILQQSRPFEIFQIFVSPLTGSVLWGRKFGGCWFTSIGEVTPDAEKNEPIIEDGEIQATYVRPLSSSLNV